MGGPSQSNQQTQNQLTQQDIAISQQQQAQSNTLFNESQPGFQTAENYYTKLASGNPQAIFQSIAPAVGQIDTASQGAVQNIQQNMPRGGAEQLAVANVQQQRAGQVGNLGTQAYTGAFPALASLSQGGLGISGNEIAGAISASSAGSTSNQAEMQVQAQGKASTMGLLGGLAGAGGEAASGGLSNPAKCWIAEAIFGVNDLHTHIIRFWLNGRFSKTVFGAIVMWLYGVIGHEVAWCARHSETVRNFLKPVFDVAFRKAIGVRQG